MAGNYCRAFFYSDKFVCAPGQDNQPSPDSGKKHRPDPGSGGNWIIFARSLRPMCARFACTLLLVFPRVSAPITFQYPRMKSVRLHIFGKFFILTHNFFNNRNVSCSFKINIVISSFLSGWQPLTLSGLLQLAYIPECVRIIH